MAAVARILLWAFGAALVTAPVLLAVAQHPGQLARLTEGASYDGLYRDLLFCAVAFLALGSIDLLETIISVSRGLVGRLESLLLVVVTVLLCVLIGQLVLYSYWSASAVAARQAVGSEVFWVLAVALVSAFLCRLIAVLGP